MDINEKIGRLEYLEGRVKQLMEQTMGYQEVIKSNECIMAAMVKAAGGEMVVKMDDIKLATERAERIKYKYEPENRTFTLTTEG